MDQRIRIYEYEIETKFNPVKFNQPRYKQTTAAKTSKVMFKNTSKKTIIIAAIVIALIIATIIFFVVRNKKKKKAAKEKEALQSSTPEKTPVANRPAKSSSVIPTEDQPGATPKKPTVSEPKAANTQPKPAAPTNSKPVGNNIGQTRPAEKNEEVKPPVEPMLIEKKLNEMEEVVPNITLDAN